MEIFNRVRNTIRRYEMLEKGDRVLICISGGPDSVFLLKALLYLKKEFGIELFMANLDHGIRGKSSEGDSKFVKALSKRYGVRLFFKKLRFKKDKSLSVEETARKERYKFFEEIAKNKKINKIATAHTLDDLAETVLMRIIKGTSLKGLIGIPPKRASGNCEYIRPLLEIEKKDIVEFLEENRLAYRVDPTNFSNKYFRNVVRNRIIPYLSKFNPRIKRALANLAENLREDRNFIESEKNKRENLIRQYDGMTALNLKDIVIQPKAIQKEITKDALSKVGSNLKKLTYEHWKEIYSLIRIRPSGKSLDLPGRIRLRKEKDRLIFFKDTLKY